MDDDIKSKKSIKSKRNIRSKMKLRSLLSLEGVGLESNRSSALTEYGCEQVKKYIIVRKSFEERSLFSGGC